MSNVLSLKRNKPADNYYVHYDKILGDKGTCFPMGTKNFPVNNMKDANYIWVNRGLKGIKGIS